MPDRAAGFCRLIGALGLDAGPRAGRDAEPSALDSGNLKSALASAGSGR